MIRNLKAMMLAALALAAVGALAASAAQAHTPEVPATFTSAAAKTTLTTLPDGSGKTTHQVFDIKKSDGTGTLPITCNSASGTGTLEGTQTTEALGKTPGFGGGCTFLGQSVTVTNTGCDFKFTADGTLHIVNDGALECAHGKQPIEFQTAAPLECKVEVGAQTLNGIKYHNLDAAGTTVETNGQTITIEATNIGGITYNATGKDCPYGTTHNGEFTTGNAIITGDEHGTSTMTNISWHKAVATVP
jgi:opacity protein-like surface antigen